VGYRESATAPLRCLRARADMVGRLRGNNARLRVSYRSSPWDDRPHDPDPRRPCLEGSGQTHASPSHAYWPPLTQVQRVEFVELFKRFLSDRYAEKIEGYSGEQVGYLSERIEGTYAEVRTELRSDKTTIPMDYRLFSKEDRWHAYDIVVDGVSLVKNYRSQFQKIIRESSYEELVKKLRERTLTEARTTKP
jgi:MlaC protein